MTKAKIIKNIRNYVQKKFESEGTGHDWYHIERVWKIAKVIAQKEKDANLFIVELAALLHDIADWKFHKDFNSGAKRARAILKTFGVKEENIRQVLYIIERVSFKGGTELRAMASTEGKIVQDADRLDALGAIGIARAFAYGGFRKRILHNPKQKPFFTTDFNVYKKYQGTTINHFYEKVLLLKDGMQTKTGKRMALRRHNYIKNFLKEFYTEWGGII